MKRLPVILGLALFTGLFSVDNAVAQISDMTPTSSVATRSTFPRPRDTFKFALQNRFSPRPIYTYSQPGITAQRVHEWNGQQQNNYPWHGNYNLSLIHI